MREVPFDAIPRIAPEVVTRIDLPTSWLNIAWPVVTAESGDRLWIAHPYAYAPIAPMAMVVEDGGRRRDLSWLGPGAVRGVSVAPGAGGGAGVAAVAVETGGAGRELRLLHLDGARGDAGELVEIVSEEFEPVALALADGGVIIGQSSVTSVPPIGDRVGTMHAYGAARWTVPEVPLFTIGGDCVLGRDHDYGTVTHVARDARTGEARWTRTYETAPQAVHDWARAGLILVQSADTIIAVDARSGEHAWRRVDSAVVFCEPRARFVCVKASRNWDPETEWPPSQSLIVLDRDGREVTRRDDLDANLVRSMDDAHVVCIGRGGLRCETIAGGTDPVWEIAEARDEREHPAVSLRYLPARGRLVRWGWNHLSVLRAGVGQRGQGAGAVGALERA